VEVSLGLRERKKAATRLALHEAALRLALERGPDGVTVEDIAEAALVSRRTFSNYFSGKEEALLYRDHLRMARLLELLRERPAAETPWTAMTRTVRELHREGGGPDSEWAAQLRLIRGHPTLLAHQVGIHTALEKDIAAEITARLPPRSRTGVQARMLAATFLATLRVATQAWLEQSSDTPLIEVAERALREAAKPFV
jgi:AcrR family transcriptional regulator